MCLAFTYIKHPLHGGLRQLDIQLLQQFQTFLEIQASVLVNICLLELLFQPPAITQLYQTS
jgi:hypothetical protein